LNNILGLDEKQVSLENSPRDQESIIQGSSVALRDSLTEFHFFGEEQFPNPCDNCEIMKNQVKKVKHKYEFSVDAHAFQKKQKQILKEQLKIMTNQRNVLQQQKSDAEQQKSAAEHDARNTKKEKEIVEKQSIQKDKRIEELQKDVNICKKDKEDKDIVIKDQMKKIDDQAKFLEEKEEIIKVQSMKIEALEQPKELTMDQVIEFLQKKKDEETRNSHVENGDRSRKCFAKKRTSQEQGPAIKKKRLDMKED